MALPPPGAAAAALEVEVKSAQQLRRRRCGGGASYKVVAVAWVVGGRGHHQISERSETSGAPFSSDGTCVSWNQWLHLTLPLAPAGGGHHMGATPPPYPPFSSLSTSSWSLHIQIFYRHPLLLGFRRVIARLTIPSSVVLRHCSRPATSSSSSSPPPSFHLRTGLLSRSTASLTLSFQLHSPLDSPTLHEPPPNYLPPPSTSDGVPPSSYSHSTLPNSSTSAPNGSTGLPVPTPPLPIDASRSRMNLLPAPPLPTYASNAKLSPTNESDSRRAAASGSLAEALGMARRRREAAGLLDGQSSVGGGAAAVSKTEDPSVSPLYPPHHIIYAQQMEKWTPGAKA